MGYRENLYNLVLVLHLLCAIIGFGTVFLNGMYGAQAKANQGPTGLAMTKATEKVSGVAEFFIYGVFIFGLIMVFLSKDNDVQVIPWSDAWLSASMLLYIVGIGLSHGLLIPAVKKMVRLQEELVSAGGPPAGASGPPPQVAELEDLGKRVGITSTVLNVLLVVIVFLMVFKPGAEYL
jgi:uncharacterized membrane protein